MDTSYLAPCLYFVHNEFYPILIYILLILFGNSLICFIQMNKDGCRRHYDVCRVDF